MKPEKIAFEYASDVVDYVSRGMVPTKKNFEKVINKVKNPDEDDPTTTNEVYIPSRIFINCDKDTMDIALRRVYENRVRNRNIGIGIIGAMAIGLLIGGIASRSKDHEENNRLDDEYDDDDIDYLID